MPVEEFEAAVASAVVRLGPAQLRVLADRIAEGATRGLVVEALPGFPDEAAAIHDAARRVDGLTAHAAAAYLRGAAAALAHRDAAVHVESVWSGPSSHAVPVRATARVLVELVAEAATELVLMTYSARPYEPLLDALGDAIARGVAVTVVVETLQGAGSALAGQEPAAAFARLPGVQLWHWPVARRPDTGARMHAKLAVADRRVLLVSSANLTQSGAENNIEAGVLVRGGTPPRRAAEHVAELKTRGILTRLPVGHGGGA
jgi:phosphatidylserine/phosphatidylglycerophosphate/cardiolipin synthase-like enzyme